MEQANKDSLKLVVVGHVDHGKSTLIGRLLYDTHTLPQGAVDKVKKIAKQTGKPFEYAYLLDAFEEEQKQNITIDTTQIQFHTNKREYVIIDAPGHKEFLKNMISGAANAEAAFLIVDASHGIEEQSKRHASILSLIGIKNVSIIINKMDLVNYSEAHFDKVKKEIDIFLASLGMQAQLYIPVSAYCGENITKPSQKLSWYKGPFLLQAMDEIEKEQDLANKKLRFPIQDVYKFDNRRIIAGRIESGTLKVGDRIKIYPQGKTTKVASIAYWAPKDKKETAVAKESVGIILEDEFFNKRGEIIVHEQDTMLVSDTLQCSLFWMGKTDMVKDKIYTIKLATQKVKGELVGIKKVIDSSSLNSSDNKNNIQMNEVAEVTLKIQEPIAFDVFSDFQATGRFVVIDGYDVAGGGIITGSAAANKKTPLFYSDTYALQGHLFDEFFYNISQNALKQKPAINKSYTLQDHLPLTGKSYAYPCNVDIVWVKEQLVVQIQDNILKHIMPIQEYTYKNKAIVNENGFKLQIYSQQDLELFLKEIENKKIDDETLLNKWLYFEGYRKIKLVNNL